MSKANIKLNEDFEKDIQESFKKQFNSGKATATIPCPYCSALVEVVAGDNTCPSCGGSFTAGTEPYRE